MTYNSATDFIALWRNVGGAVSKTEMPGLDYVVAALARAGLLTVSVSATAPVANQATTAWLQTAVPDWSAEGSLHLWDPVAETYEAATPALLLYTLQASAGQNGVSWRTFTGPTPSNLLGNDGDFAIRMDVPYGIYGPKDAGAWPDSPIPGTADLITSATMDNTFGSAVGSVLYRGATEWEALPVGGANLVLSSSGTLPDWTALSALLDDVFGAARGGLLYRGAAAWVVLAPGTTGQVLATAGAGADPLWAPRTAEFPSGTVMLFRQAAAPTGWTKHVDVNDVGLRVVSGALADGGSDPFSSVFNQATTFSTVIDASTMPLHHHVINAYRNTGSGAGIGTGGVAQPISQQDSNTTDVGGGLGHVHGITLELAYVDVIIASKD